MKFAKIETSRMEHNPITGGFETADYVFFCPGCDGYHGVWTTNKNRNECIWKFNGDIEHPTVSPSLLMTYGDGRICHSFINNGNIQFLSDCFHKFKGQTIELPNI